MRDDWPDWAQEAWQTFTPQTRDQARIVWRTLAETFEGVLVGPGPLVRHLVDEARLGHRSTLETIARLVQEDLVHVRQAAEGPILWIPRALMPEASTRAHPSPRRPRFLATSRSNGTREAALTEV